MALPLLAERPYLVVIAGGADSDDADVAPLRGEGHAVDACSEYSSTLSRFKRMTGHAFGRRVSMRTTDTALRFRRPE